MTTLDDVLSDRRVRGAYLEGVLRGAAKCLLCALERDNARTASVRTAEALVRAAIADIVTHEAEVE